MSATPMLAFDDEAAIVRDYALFLKLGVFAHSEDGWLEFRRGFVGGGEAARRWFARRSGSISRRPAVDGVELP